jgi:ribose 5-phosphate isomerase A
MSGDSGESGRASSNSNAFEGIVNAALAQVREGMVLGLGTGRAASAFVCGLGERVRAGLKVRGVPTSEATAKLAREVGVPMVGLGEVEALDLVVDGADEVAPNLDVIKGLGGALLREKIVASAAKRLIIVVGAEKLAPALGTRGVLPVEVVPFGVDFCRRRVEALGYAARVRAANGQTLDKPTSDAQAFVTDNGNYVLDCRLRPLQDASALEQALRSIPGVVTTGLFLGMADTVLVQDGPSVQTLQRKPR